MKAKTTKTTKEFKVEDAEKIFDKLHAFLGGIDVDVETLTEENIKMDGFFAILITKKGNVVGSQQVGKRIPAVVVADSLMQILMNFGGNVDKALDKNKKIGIA